MPELISSPWGYVDHREIVDGEGLQWVFTPSHGGLMVAKWYADEYKLSEAARQFSERFGDWYGFEEDVRWQIAAYELPAMEKDVRKYYAGQPLTYCDGDDWKEKVWRCLSLYVPAYLLQRQIEPEPENYARWKEFEKEATAHGWIGV